jgi:hypothetical protein
MLTRTELSARIARFSRNDFTGNSAARVSLAWDSGSSVIWAPRREFGPADTVRTCKGEGLCEQCALYIMPPQREEITWRR